MKGYSRRSSSFGGFKTLAKTTCMKNNNLVDVYDAGDEESGHSRESLEGLELEVRGGCNGKWCILCGIRCRC